MKFRYIILHIILFISVTSELAFAQVQRYSYEKGMMGSPFVLTFYAKNDTLAKQAADSTFKRIQQLNDSLSDYRDGSEINKLSATSGTGKWVAVSKDLFNILAVAQDFSQKTDGSFDVTLGPVVQVWRRAVRKGYLPDKNEIKEAMEKTGYRKLLLDPETRRVMLTQKGMRLDIGGLGKGFAADEAIKVMESFGITSALIDAGGKLAITNPPPAAKGWKIKVSSGRDSLGTIELANAGVATSGPTYRYLEFEGKKYSHIVDPKTGIGLQYHVRTTVISPNATDADVLATAFSVTGIRNGRKYLKKYYSASRVWLVETRNGKETSWNTIGQKKP
ncbi:FAD:protein FMN transferase [Dyadobacter sp. NIV53]|uniref:FAD:protein FMN transferase n=1 Tax=Dyadobacter sp. NIV53 TaxID=2861765 RepID=UPI001C875D77|nr:FAD:protein FMN transferase [Dyadobacter sp. NIV53]